MPEQLNILLSPLDWGLGHATRCIPLIRYLLHRQCRVTLAARGATAVLLKSNFPELTILPIEGYNVSYSRIGGFTPFKILAQVPGILNAIKKERHWLQQMQDQHQFDLVISDNRYGLKIKNVPSVILTHQLQIKTGAGAFFDVLLRHLHYRVLERFDYCWVVDRKHGKNIGGELSHPGRLPLNAAYIGILSQFNRPLTGNTIIPGRILILLSGPEPQRSILEKTIISQLTADDYTYCIVGGKPGAAQPQKLPAGSVYYAHRNASELTELISEAELIICRSGYSTLMDLACMGKKALLIPTPGQAEQQYLAGYLAKQGLFYSSRQSSLHLKSDMKEAMKYPGFTDNSWYLSLGDMNSAVDEVIAQLRQ